ncbi:tyrosine-type recombinase/integrase [Telluria sp. B2]
MYKRGKTWWIDFTTPRGERVRRSAQTGDRIAAQELHDRLKAEAWRVQQLGERPAYTWDDAGYRWLQETAHKRTHGDDIAKLAWLQQFLRGRPLAEITREEIAAIGERKKAEASGATANRYLSLIRAILRKAWQEWEWIDRAPKLTLYRESKRRVRWITSEQAKVLLAELPEHQRDITLFALATGLRQANVTKLEWQQVDLDRGTCWIAGEQAKAGEDLHVSLNDVAREVLRRQRGKHATRVFTYMGRPITQVNTKAWRKALQRAGIENFRWHDLRHTWASWLVQHGTPLYDLQEMGGWKSATMVRRYAHLAPAQLAQHAAVVDGLLATSALPRLDDRGRKP